MAGGISCIVLVKNEEKNILKCIESLSWCDEIIVIDDYSSDNTVKIAQKYTKNIFQHALNNDFAQQRNFGLLNVNKEWVLFVDADEVVSISLQYEISSLISDQFSQLNGYKIKRIDQMWGKILLHGEMGNISLLRLARKNAGEWKGKVHEVWNIKGNVGKLQKPLLHYPHKTVADFLDEINKYSTIKADELIESKQRIHAWQILAYPKVKFIYNYFLKLGFLDGMPGFIVALMMSFHSFLARSKAWQMQSIKNINK